MKLLVVNPNTTRSVTALLCDRLRERIGAGVEVLGATAPFGASYIASETSFAIAGHAALDAWAQHVAGHGAADALLLGCFGDPGVAALREATARPVIGLAEASMRAAARHGRFAIVTGGAAWQPMLARLARALGLAEHVAGIHTVAPSGAELAADPVGANVLLRDACRNAASGADCVVLGGAALAGMAAAIAPELEVPLIDSVDAGADAVLAAAQSDAPAPASPGSGATWSGLSPALAERLR